MIVICGCSYLSGYGLLNHEKSFLEILKQKTKKNILNLSKPGASNYCISKQIDYAITLNPELIIFGITEYLRFDWVKENKNIDSIPSILDFEYTNNIENLNFKNKIMSQSFRTLDAYLNNIKHYFSKKTYQNENKDYLWSVRNMMINTNFFIKQDIDHKIIINNIYNLEKNDINFILIRGKHEFKYANPKKTLDITWQDLINEDPQIDKIHFGYKSQQKLAELISQKIFN